MARRSSGSPAVGEYRWFAGFRHASTAAATMCSGVGKSGSPAPKPTTGSPAAWSALALASTASVADSAMDAMRRETRESRVTGPSWHAPTAGTGPIAAIRREPATSLSRQMTRIRRARPRQTPDLRIGVGARIALLAVTVLATVSTVAAAPAGAAGPPATQAPQSYVAIDGETGAVVAAANEHAPHLTASTIKILTALVTLEHLPLTAPIHVSRLAASQPAMKIGMQEGSTWPLDQALASLLIVSANDSAYALAESAGGDLDHFDALATTTG